ncbi:MAG TPA: pilus assembly protein TadG-related protein [Planctomycetaceae bacterium]|nr:pilus assembly protein TadG-related protein [Planctomycetaceae bacterium]
MPRRWIATTRQGSAFLCAKLRAVALRLHRDEDGTISVLTVITLLMFTMLLGLLINVGLQIDDKVKMQNAADAATYSGGVALARGMNSIAFTNHLLSEVFALTAYYREGRDRHAEQFVPQVLNAWSQIGPVFARSQFQRFAQMGPAITPKVPMEQELVTAFGELTAAKSKVVLPVLEYLLGQPEAPPLPPANGNGQQQGGGNGQQGNGNGQGQQSAAQTHIIPQFQRAVVQTIPNIAQLATQEIAKRHGPAQQTGPRTQALAAALWRTRGLPVGYPSETDPHQRTLPAIDPSNEGQDAASLSQEELSRYQGSAVPQRNSLAHMYLNEWNNDHQFDLGPFEREYPDPNWRNEGGKISGKMSQFVNFWRIFTCGQLNHLLNVEYPTTNLPHVIRTSDNGVDLDADHMFIGVVYWPHKAQFFPGMYRSPMQGSALAFSQVFLYIPRARYRCCPWAWPVYDRNGQIVGWNDNMDPWPGNWDLFNQNWTVRLVPTTSPTVPFVLQSPPTGVVQQPVQMPNLGGMSAPELNQINTH